MAVTDFRPTSFDELVGQEEVKEYLQYKIASVKETGDPMGHVLILGPSGCGKTTFARAIAAELDKDIISISATRLDTWVKVLATLERISPGDILFIDELHSMPKKIQEQFYDVLEDFKADMFVGRGADKEAITIPISPFTLVAATTHTGDLNGPLLRRFSYRAMLAPYTVPQLKDMAAQAYLRMYDEELDPKVALKIAQLARRNASATYALLKNYREVSQVIKDQPAEVVFDKVIRLEKLDPLLGLDYASRRYLARLNSKQGKPVGAEVLAQQIGEQVDTVKNVIEPFLISPVEIAGEVQPLVEITRTGRRATELCDFYIQYCRELQTQKGWFPGEVF